MAFDEVGQADNYERRIEICERSYNILVDDCKLPSRRYNFRPQYISCSHRDGRTSQKCTRFFLMPQNGSERHLPHVNVSGGVSNVSFSFRGNNVVREAMHSAFLYHGIKHGMTMGIVNPTMLEVYDEIPKDLLEHVEDVLLDRRDDATERLLEFAETVKGQKKDNESSHNSMERTTITRSYNP